MFVLFTRPFFFASVRQDCVSRCWHPSFSGSILNFPLHKGFKTCCTPALQLNSSSLLGVLLVLLLSLVPFVSLSSSIFQLPHFYSHIPIFLVYLPPTQILAVTWSPALHRVLHGARLMMEDKLATLGLFDLVFAFAVGWFWWGWFCQGQGPVAVYVGMLSWHGMFCCWNWCCFGGWSWGGASTAVSWLPVPRLLMMGCVPSFVAVCLCKLLLLVSAHVVCELLSIWYEVQGSFFDFWPIYTFDGALESWQSENFMGVLGEFKFGFLMELGVIVGWIMKGGSINWCGYSPWYTIQNIFVRLNDSLPLRTVYIELSYVEV